MIAAGYLPLIKKFILVWNYALQDVTQDRSDRDVKYSIKNEIFNQFVVFSVFNYVKSSDFSFKCSMDEYHW